MQPPKLIKPSQPMQALYIYSTDPQYLRKPSPSVATNGTTSDPVHSTVPPGVAKSIPTVSYTHLTLPTKVNV